MKPSFRVCILASVLLGVLAGPGPSHQRRRLRPEAPKVPVKTGRENPSGPSEATWARRAMCWVPRRHGPGSAMC